MIRVALPDRIRTWLESLRASWRSDKVLFVHAGVNPNVDLERFLAVPWNTPLDAVDGGQALGLGALALPRRDPRSRRLRRLLRRPRPHAQRRPTRPLPRGADPLLPAEPRRRLGKHRSRADGRVPRVGGQGADSARPDQRDAEPAEGVEKELFAPSGTARTVIRPQPMARSAGWPGIASRAAASASTGVSVPVCTTVRNSGPYRPFHSAGSRTSSPLVQRHEKVSFPSRP